jgi:hypothetical protein
VGKFKAVFRGAITIIIPRVVSMSMRCSVRLSQPTDSDTRFAQ